MDIYLTAVKSGKGELRFPSLPEEIQVKEKTNYRTYNVLSIGQVMLPFGNKIDQVSWKGWFFGENHRQSYLNRRWRDPKYCIERLNKWKKDGAILRLLVTWTSINMDVTIADFSYRHVGFLDVEYQITLYSYGTLKMYTTTEMGTTAYESSTTPRPDSTKTQYPQSGLRCVVRANDTLWTLAEQAYGDGGKWGQIYSANQGTIEQAAIDAGLDGSDKGAFLQPGTQLIIP